MISIREAMDDGTYGEIGPADRREVLAALARIRTALGPSGDASRLNERRKLRVFNDQELINNILTSADEDSRLVCRREKKTGTHMASNQCMTVAERQRAADHARETLLRTRSEEQTSELQSLMRISYAVFCLKKKTSIATARRM